MDLNVLGWNDFFEESWKAHDRHALEPGRVIEEQKEAYRVVGASGELAAEITGRLRYAALERSDFPAVGDWVAMEAFPEEGKALIHLVLPRRTKLSRKAAGDRTVEQILVTNVDTAFVVMSLNADFNLRRLERYLGAVWQSGAQAVVLLSKADLCGDREALGPDVAEATPGVNSHVLSAYTGEGLEALEAYIGPGRTVVLLGSSGVGKSTIINRLLGSETQKTLEIRSADDRGRHATTYRRLFLMPSGGVLIDTPGMREFEAWDAETGLEDAFDELAAISANCRFRDCTHETEPGCAVLAGVAGGTLDPDRLANYRKLKRELLYQELRRDAAAQAEQKRLRKQIQRAHRQRYKLKG